MKIRCVSIDLEMAQPIHNEALMEKAVIKAEKDEVDLLVFQAYPLNGLGMGDTIFNERFLSENKKALNKFKEFLLDYNLSVVYNYLDEQGECEVGFWDELPNMEVLPGYSGVDKRAQVLKASLNGKTIIIDMPCGIDNLEWYFSAKSLYTAMSEFGKVVYIMCSGLGHQPATKGIYSNMKLIACDGKLLAYTDDDNELTYNIDMEVLENSRRKNNLDTIRTPYYENKDYDIYTDPYPYLPKGVTQKDLFDKVVQMQADGLYQKMRSMNRYKITIGISGGLDSTVSLLSCVECFKKYNLPLTDIIGVTMPGLGTTERTYNNAIALMKNLGITLLDIDLKSLLKMHLDNIKQPEGKFDVTFEQCQSRERTQVLLDLANKENAIMIGTGCMSEFALGWMSYGGDHLCMYAINIGLPKTMVKMFARYYIDEYSDFKSLSGKKVAKVVEDILDGPVSPELLPIDEKGEQHEKTESIIGDYRVQDFFIYHMTVNNISIKKLFKWTCHNFSEYEPKQILKWLEIFTLRFFTRAYKKNCYGDGMSFLRYSASPYSYYIPSDIDYTIWKQEIEELKGEIK